MAFKTSEVADLQFHLCALEPLGNLAPKFRTWKCVKQYNKLVTWSLGIHNVAAQAVVHNRAIRQPDAASVSQSKQACDTRIRPSPGKATLPKSPQRISTQTSERCDRVVEKKRQQFVLVAGAQQTVASRIEQTSLIN